MKKYNYMLIVFKSNMLSNCFLKTDKEIDSEERVGEIESGLKKEYKEKVMLLSFKLLKVEEVTE